MKIIVQIIICTVLTLSIKSIPKAGGFNMDGNGTVIENVDSNNYPFGKPQNENEKYEGEKRSETKQFITFETKDGKIFHLIVDHDQTQDNVKLVTEVSEEDLVSLVDKEQQESTPNVNQSINHETENQKTEETENKVENNEINETESKNKSSLGSYFILGGIVIGVLGIAYYLKVIKPKKKNKEDEKEEEEDDFFEEE